MARVPSSLVRLSYRIHFPDVVVGALAPFAAIHLRDLTYLSRSDLEGFFIYSLIATLATVGSIVHFRVGLILSRFFSSEDIKQVLKAAAAASLITAGVAFMLMRLDTIPRSMPLLHFTLLAVGLIGTRALRSEHYRKHDQRGHSTSEPQEAVLLVGATRMAWFYIRMLDCIPARGQRIIALLDEDRHIWGRSICGIPVAGNVERTESILTEYASHGVAIDRIIISYPEASERAAAERALAPVCAKRGIRLESMTDRFDIQSISQPAAEETDSEELVGVPTRIGFYWRIRRIADIVCAGAAIVILAPLFVIVALVVLIDVGAPTVFWQQRVGRNGVPMFIHKFRTFRAAVDRSGAKVPEDQRISRIGRCLRATRLDELPQLWDILRGEMSIIGPRPLLPVDLPEESSLRLQVPPGLTGWAQVHGGKLVTVEEKNALDEWYIAHASVMIDLRIIWLTFLTSMRGDRRTEFAVKNAMRFRAQRLLYLKTHGENPAPAKLGQQVSGRAA